jgi:hypothetical protein
MAFALNPAFPALQTLFKIIIPFNLCCGIRQCGRTTYESMEDVAGIEYELPLPVWLVGHMGHLQGPC